MQKKRGRKTSALSIVTDENISELLPQKPQAPDELSSDEGEVWISVIEVHDQQWISKDQFPLLVQYCRHTIAARRVKQFIEALEKAAQESDEDTDYLALLGPFNKLLSAQERESRAIKALATALRITNQSRYQSTNAKVRPTRGGKKLWET